MSSKKGYFFIIDAIIGLFVIVIGVVLIYSVYMYEPSGEQITLLSFDMMNFLSSNKLSDINDPYAGPNGILYKNGNITNIDITLIEQVAEFYYRNITFPNTNTIPIIDSFVSNISKEAAPSTYGFIIKIENYTVYNRSGLKASNFSDSIVVIPSKKLVHGIYNRTELFGPYLCEVIVWR
jgi:hypothetical protein